MAIEEARIIRSPTKFWKLMVSERNSTDIDAPNIGVRHSRIADKLVGIYRIPRR